MWMPSKHSRDHFNSVLRLTQDYKNRVTAVCPRVLRLSVNIKDTAGCCVFRKQVSLHKQLYNKSCPFPLLMFACMSFPFYGPSVLQPRCLQWLRVFITHTATSGYWHNDTIVTLLHTTRPYLPHDLWGQLTHFWM